jgi:hypothetical protein
MLIFTALKWDRRKFLALTGLTLKEFKILLPAFEKAYQAQYAGNETAAGQKRKRKAGGAEQRGGSGRSVPASYRSATTAGGHR